MKKVMKPGRRYFVINIDEPYAEEIYKVLKNGQMAKGEWPEGDISFEEWEKQTFGLDSENGLFDEQECRICGCTWNNACEGGCYWVEWDLCSRCSEKQELERLKKLIDEVPDFCPITKLRKCEHYVIGDNVVYLTNPAYDAYTLPEYNSETKEFFRTHYDMDDDNKEEYEFLCELDDLRNREDIQEIKKFYNIQD